MVRPYDGDMFDDEYTVDDSHLLALEDMADDTNEDSLRLMMRAYGDSYDSDWLDN